MYLSNKHTYIYCEGLLEHMQIEKLIQLKKIQIQISALIS